MAGVLRRSWWPLLVTQLTAWSFTSAFLPDAPFGRRPSGSAALWWSAADIVVDLFVVGLLVAAGVVAVVFDAAGRWVSFGKAVGLAVPRTFAMFGRLLAAGLLVAAGSALLVLPGLYLVVVFGAALAGVVTIERAGLRRCRELVGPRFRAAAARVLPAASALLGYGFAGHSVLPGMAAVFGGGPLATGVLRVALLVPAGMVAVAVMVVTYAELRWREDPSVTSTRLVDNLVGKPGRAGTAVTLILFFLVVLLTMDLLTSFMAWKAGP